MSAPPRNLTTAGIPYNRHTAPAMGRAPAYKHEIASLRKNSGERLVVTLEEYNRSDLCNLTVRRDGSGQHRKGKMKATARVVSIRVSQLPALIAALQDARAKAVDMGTLEPEPDA